MNLYELAALIAIKRGTHEKRFDQSGTNFVSIKIKKCYAEKLMQWAFKVFGFVTAEISTRGDYARLEFGQEFGSDNPQYIDLTHVDFSSKELFLSSFI